MKTRDPCVTPQATLGAETPRRRQPSLTDLPTAAAVILGGVLSWPGQPRVGRWAARECGSGAAALLITGGRSCRERVGRLAADDVDGLPHILPRPSSTTLVCIYISESPRLNGYALSMDHDRIPACGLFLLALLAAYGLTTMPSMAVTQKALGCSCLLRTPTHTDLP
jgi:hypothetical protein